MDLVCCFLRQEDKTTEKGRADNNKKSITKPRRPLSRMGIDQYEATLLYMLNSPSVDDSMNGTVVRRRRTPIKILDYLYLGTCDDADNFRVLGHLGITHVINCAAYSSGETVSASLSRSGIFKYLEFHADDIDEYDITQHFEMAVSFIDEAKKLNGKVLVHCMKGVNRSVSVITAYLVIALKINLFEAVNYIHKRKSKILTNPGFRKQLIVHADSIGLLPSLEDVYRLWYRDYNGMHRDKSSMKRSMSPVI